MSAYQQFQVILQTEIYHPELDPFLNKSSLSSCPIGNKPLIYYQLEYLEKYGFNDILIVTKDTHFSKLKDLVDKYTGNTKPDDINYYIIENENTDQDVESLLLLKELVEHNKIKKDFIYFSGNLFLDETLNDVIDSHILKNSSLTVVFQEFKAPLEEREDYSIMVVDKTEDRLIKLSSFQGDIAIEQNFKVSKHSIAKFPNTVVLANCVPSGMFIAKKEVANLLLAELPDFSFEDYSNFEDEFVPYLVRNQFNPQLIDALEGLVSEDELLIDTLSSVKKNFKDKFSVHAYIVKKSFSKKIVTLADLFQSNMACLVKPNVLPQIFNNTRNNPELFELVPEKAKGDNKPQAEAAETAAPKEGKKAKKGAAAAAPAEEKKEAPVAEPKGQEAAPKNELKNVTINNSKIVKSIHLEDKVKIERSIIGPNCTIKKGAKVVNSVLLKGVVVEEDAIVEGSILFEKVTVGAKTKVKTCFVKGHIQLPEKENFEKESISE